MRTEFCMRSICPYQECEMHRAHAPGGCAVRVSEFKCEKFDQFCVDMANMGKGRAENIVFNIGKAEVPKEMKLAAIKKVVGDGGSRMLGRDELYGVIRYLLSLTWNYRMMDEYVSHGKLLIKKEEENEYDE